MNALGISSEKFAPVDGTGSLADATLARIDHARHGRWPEQAGCLRPADYLDLCLGTVAVLFKLGWKVQFGAARGNAQSDVNQLNYFDLG